ncbi:MAG: IS110 family transposase [Bacilli bacterium]|nr:IS110 family transposase [Bacilli bacterium]
MTMVKVATKGSLVKYEKGLQMINPHAGGLDLHQETIWACVAADRDGDSQVKTFGTCTAELRRLAKWLRDVGVTTAAMESTGVFWMPVYDILEKTGLHPLLVNAAMVKGIKGRPKTDRLDCMWICRLHSYGLLSGSFIPPPQVVALKSLCDCREKIIAENSRTIQRIQKTLQRMNCRLDNAVSDVTGDSGMRIIEAILAGERDAMKLADLSDIRCKKDRAAIALDLEGNFQPELLTVLGEWYEHYCFYQQRLSSVNTKIYALLEQFPKKAKAADLPPKPAHYREAKKEFILPLRPLLFEIFGADLTQLSGIGPTVILSFLATVGSDVSAWPTENHFASWLGLAPNPQISAEHRKKGKTKRVKNLLATNLKIVAMAVQRSDSFLGAFHRRLKARIGPSLARIAVARKMAIILYRLTRDGGQAIKFSAEQYEQLYRERKLKNLKRQAINLGFDLVAVPAVNS